MHRAIGDPPRETSAIDGESVAAAPGGTGNLPGHIGHSRGYLNDTFEKPLEDGGSFGDARTKIREKGGDFGVGGNTGVGGKTGEVEHVIGEKRDGFVQFLEG